MFNMFLKKTDFFLLLISFLFFNSCKHEFANPNIDSPTVSAKCDPDTVYFVNSILPIILSNCAMSGCHGNGSSEEGVELSNYKNIFKTGKIVYGNPEKSKLYQSIVGSNGKKTMPSSPNNRLSTDQVNLIKKWIEQGGKNNSCADDCDSSLYTYSNQIAPIIQNNCLGCHNTNSIKIGTYSELKTEVDNGRLWGSINHKIGFKAMPSDDTKITDCEIKKIEKWIADGAPNN